MVLVRGPAGEIRLSVYPKVSIQNSSDGGSSPRLWSPLATCHVAWGCGTHPESMCLQVMGQFPSSVSQGNLRWQAVEVAGC